ncbi:MAG TPA: endopeptidase La [Oligoflexia bacterium]|nr:endopeptidase La [Oligoflexia bacterium]HMR25142.1 endopeptidase La [Oligoflexia bacterium]
MLFDQDEKEKTVKNKRKLPLLPLRDIIVFPHMVVPLYVGRKKSVAALEHAMASDKDLLLCAQKSSKNNDPTPEDIYTMGTLGSIMQMQKLPDGTVRVLIEGKTRAKIHSYEQNEKFYMCSIDEVKEDEGSSVEVEALMRTVHATFEVYIKLNKKIPPEMLMSVAAIDDPSRLADTIAAHLTLKQEDKQEVLEIIDAKDRLEKLYTLMQSEIEILQVEKKIQSRVKKQMEKTQKDYYLNERMNAIQKELGEKDEFKAEMDELEKRIKNKKLSKEADEKVKKEFKKLKMMSPMAAEATVVRNYIDWILDLPWYKYSEDKLDLQAAQHILDKDHFGLDKVKKRILEYLAVQKLVKKIKGPILCFVGPPGVGKTSLARSIATAMGRKFVRISVGGLRDEAEIRGHRRTYIGAMPGKLIQSLKKAGTSNPVFLIDEIDKMSSDFRGDPSSAMLEVLDPEQNVSFNDHYLDLDYDLSKVTFLATANSLHTIPRPLLDRMEIISLAGYTEDEKLNIAKQYLVDKQKEANGLSDNNISFNDAAIRKVIRRYTKEAGVRNLERELASLCRKIAREVVEKGKQHHRTITSSNVAKYLGVEKFKYGKAHEIKTVGRTIGLAWTELGGDLLDIEATIMPGNGKLTMTGKLGDVMKESAHAALSYVRSRAKALGLRDDFYSKIDIHIHVPEGAIPKDGPSAGVTMATSLASALLHVPVRNDVAMTGEITIAGRVLPIGGLKEKILAAHRGGIKTIIIPKENEKDLKDIPKNVLKELTVHAMQHADEVLKEALALEDSSRADFLSNIEGFLPPIFEKDAQEAENKPVH